MKSPKANEWWFVKLWSDTRLREVRVLEVTGRTVLLRERGWFKRAFREEWPNVRFIERHE